MSVMTDEVPCVAARLGNIAATMAAIVSWSDVTVSVPARKKQSARTILSAVSGYASAGTAPEGGLAAIMGPSGSGKSTLLGVLLQNEPRRGAQDDSGREPEISTEHRTSAGMGWERAGFAAPSVAFAVSSVGRVGTTSPYN